MTTMASQITSLTVVYSTVYSDADQRKHQSSASLAFVWGIHPNRWIPRTNGQLRGIGFHLMTSSCSLWILLQAVSWQFIPALSKRIIFPAGIHLTHLPFVLHIWWDNALVECCWYLPLVWMRVINCIWYWPTMAIKTSFTAKWLILV